MRFCVQAAAIAGHVATAVHHVSSSTSEGDACGGPTASNLALLPHPTGLSCGSLHQLHGLCMVHSTSSPTFHDLRDITSQNCFCTRHLLHSSLQQSSKGDCCNKEFTEPSEHPRCQLLVMLQLLWLYSITACCAVPYDVTMDDRVFVAQREDYEDTWINNYSPFVSEYAADATASALTAQEVSCSNTPCCTASSCNGRMCKIAVHLSYVAKTVNYIAV